MTAARSHMLWRIDINDSDFATADLERLTDGLRLHLAHATLTTVLAHIGERAQGYLVLSGCAGCAHDRCAPGCHGELLRRLLRQVWPGINLRPAPSGLAPRPYTCVVLATPGRRPQPLDAALLDAWPEARLTLSWRNQRARPQVGALLAVGPDDPSPAAALRSRGWRSWPVPDRLARRWIRAPLPAAPLLAGAHSLTPTLLVPGLVAPALLEHTDEHCD